VSARDIAIGAGMLTVGAGGAAAIVANAPPDHVACMGTVEIDPLTRRLYTQDHPASSAGAFMLSGKLAGVTPGRYVLSMVTSAGSISEVVLEIPDGAPDGGALKPSP